MNLDDCDVVWDTPSENAHGSMPAGNGDIGINAWVEPSGDLLLYVSKTDAWDESCRLCKIGRLRISFDPPLPVQDSFCQVLKLAEGAVAISAGATKLRVWVDANQPVVRVDAESATPVTCRATVELWRRRERAFAPDQPDSWHGGEDCFSGRGLCEQDPAPTVLPDTVVAEDPERVVWYHRNTTSIYPLCLKTQHLENLQAQFVDPLLHHTFGASLAGAGFVRHGDRDLVSTAPACTHALSLTVLANKAETPEAWLEQLADLEQQSVSDWDAHLAWWRAFWDRSWIFVEGEETLTRGYILQHFMSATAGRGGGPIKFNGSIFTVEGQPGADPETPAGNPDWRRWGGNLWFQNTRLAYWAMLAAGDFEMMDPWFDMHVDALPLSKARIQTYYQFPNAAQFPETMYFYGLPNNGDYGWENEKPEPESVYIRYYWNSNLELVALMLDRYDFTQDDAFARDVLVPLADPLIAFLDEFWQQRDADGKIVFDPAQSLETWHTAVNPTPEIAGLGFLLPRLLALPHSTTSAAQRSRWERLLDALPPMPTGEVDGEMRILPAKTFSDKRNSENPELYAVFPYRVYGVGRPALEVARAAYRARTTQHNRGWCQDSIQAAHLGLADEAGTLVAERAAQINTDYRFPAMWGPNFDWVPDQDHGVNILTTLQAMLLQYDGDTIYLLPAWPKHWSARFKLHAPQNTTLEGLVEHGELIDLQVTPQSRKKDVIYPVQLEVTGQKGQE